MPIELTGEDIEEIDKQVADDLIDDMEDEQKMWFEKGADFLPGRKKNPATRFLFYEQQTLPEQKLMVLDPDYREKMNAGLYPPLVPVVWYVIDPQSQTPIAGPFADEQTATMTAGGMGLLSPEMMPQDDGMGGLVPSVRGK